MLHLGVEREVFEVAHFGNATRRWQSRESLLIRLTATGLSAEGLGETSPLPGFSRDTVEQSEAALRALNGDGMMLPLDPSQIWQAWPENRRALPAAARFGVETALIDAWCKTRGWSLEHFFVRCFDGLDAASTPWLRPEALRSAPLVDLLDDHALTQARQHSDEGVVVFKVKVGANLERETRVLFRWKEWFEQQGRPLLLRLDANQTLPCKEVPRLFAEWRPLPVDYVEEPCAPEQLATLDPVSLALPLAFDESLALGETFILPWLAARRVKALVYKPMAQGGLWPLRIWARHCAKHQVPIVLSHLFDGPIAYRVYCALARVLSPGVVAGLAAHPGLGLWSSRLRPHSSGAGVGLEIQR